MGGTTKPRKYRDMNGTNTDSGDSAVSKMRPEAEIRERLDILRKQYDESDRNPIRSKEPGDRLIVAYARKEQFEKECSLRDEIAMLEWVLGGKQNWLTSWQVQERQEQNKMRI